MNLRGYKPTSKFDASGVWQFPPSKQHSPKGQYSDVKDLMLSRNKLSAYDNCVSEPNAN